jgi:hypothetical protein
MNLEGCCVSVLQSSITKSCEALWPESHSKVIGEATSLSEDGCEITLLVEMDKERGILERS